MQKLVLILLLSAFFTVCLTAPTNQQAIVEELLAEASSHNLAAPGNTAEIEQNELLRSLLDGLNNRAQEGLKGDENGIFRTALNWGNKFLQDKLRSPSNDISEELAKEEEAESLVVQEESDEDTMADIEQNSLRDLLTDVINIGNDYAQEKLRGRNKEGVSRLLNRVTEYVQEKLQPTHMELAKEEKAEGLVIQEESDENTMADMEQDSLRNLIADVINIGNDSAQKKLLSRNKESASKFLNRVNRYVQGKLQPTPSAIEQALAQFRGEKEKLVAQAFANLALQGFK